LLQNANTTLQNADSTLGEIEAVFAKIEEGAKYIDKLDLSQGVDFPICIKKSFGGADYMIAFHSLEVIAGQGTRVNASMKFDIPGSDRTLYFKAVNVTLNKGGISEGKLFLVKNEDFFIGPNKITLIGTNNNTYVSFDCDGFKEMSIDGQVTFSPSIMTRDRNPGVLRAPASTSTLAGGNTTPPPPTSVSGAASTLAGEAVTASFQTKIQKWGQLLVEVSLPPFQISSLKGFTFTLSTAVLDFSETANSGGMIFPPGYEAKHLAPGNVALWEGLFVKEFTVYFPTGFKSKEGSRSYLQANNLIVDHAGISGNFKGKYLLDIEKGKIADWQFSIDSAEITLVANNLIAGGIGGRIKLPVSSKKSLLGYGAIVHSNGDYLFAIKTLTKQEFSLWMADVILLPNSSVVIAGVGGEFYPKANLTGSISINSTNEPKASIAAISFQNLQLQTIAPLITVGAFSFSSGAQQKASNFPISIKDVGMRTLSGNKIALDFTIALNLVGEGDNGFTASSSLSVIGEAESLQEIASWKYHSIQLNNIKVDIQATAFKLKGELIVYREHPVFGEGFKGMIAAEFLPGIKVDATAQFGTVRSMRYFYCDALLTISAGLPIGTTGMGFYGFGGGCSLHMERKMPTNTLLPASALDNPSDSTNTPGKSLSGVEYVPNANYGLGIRAKIIIGTHPMSETFNGDVEFEVMFNSTGGVATIAFRGNVAYMKKIIDPYEKAQVYASIVIAYNFQKSSLDANLKVYVNVPNVIKGTGASNKAGEAVLHFSPSKWFIYLGHPDEDKRLGVEFITLGVNITAYMCAGTEIPDIPPVNSEVTRILGREYNMRDDASLLQGGGFAFGAAISVKKDLSFLIFYSSMSAGIGFDIMLKNYGTGVSCENSTGPIGMNGWYAKGQLYAYLSGSIGVEVNLSVIKGKFKILDVGVAAVLQAALPNPTWMVGACGGYYNILDGLVSGQCNFEVRIGEKCKFVSDSPLGDMKVIGECSPPKDETKVSVFNNPQATFNIKPNTAFNYVDMNDNSRTIRVKFDHIKIKTPAGNEIVGNTEWNTRGDVVAFNSSDILPPSTKMTMLVRVHFEEKSGENWQTIFKDGKEAFEEYSAFFTTGVAPNFIPKENVDYSYPIDNMVNYYKDEYNKGYIQLDKGQDYLFNYGSEWQQRGRYKTASGTGPAAFTYTYDTQNNRISFDQPSGLSIQTGYSFELVNIPVRVEGAVDKNVTTVTSQAYASADTSGNTLNLTTKDVEGSRDVLQEKVIFDMKFRTSKYATFSAKIDNLTADEGWIWPLLPAVPLVGMNCGLDEYFDTFEIQGDSAAGKSPMVRVEAEMNMDWYNNYLYPIIYTGPLTQGFNISWRTPFRGVPPSKAVFIDQNVYPNLGGNINYVPPVNVRDTYIKYHLPYFTYRDYDDLQTQAANSSLRNSNTWAKNIIEKMYPGILINKNYNINLGYRPRGLSANTSNKVVQLLFNFFDNDKSK